MKYAESQLVAASSKDQSSENSSNEVISKGQFADKVVLGMRMPSFKILNQSDARPWHLQERLKSDGRWRVLVFAGNIKNSTQLARVNKLGEQLAAPTSFLSRYRPTGKAIDSVIEVLTIHSSPRRDVTIFDLPDIFHPYDDEVGWDYWKIYVDDESYHEGHGEAYKNYGIDAETGCAIIVRPDQYVSWIGAVDDYQQMDLFFSKFMKAQDQS